jgi:hypothetical protein
MNEEQIPNNPIETDIHRVGSEVRERTGGAITPEVTEREMVRQSLHPMVQQSGTAPAQPNRSATDDAMLPSYMKNESVDVKDRVERLVEDAFKHGVEHAAMEAQKSGPFIVDALHDALSDRFYEELKRRNLV